MSEISDKVSDNKDKLQRLKKEFNSRQKRCVSIGGGSHYPHYMIYRDLMKMLGQFEETARLAAAWDDSPYFKGEDLTILINFLQSYLQLIDSHLKLLESRPH